LPWKFCLFALFPLWLLHVSSVSFLLYWQKDIIVLFSLLLCSYIYFTQLNNFINEISVISYRLDLITLESDSTAFHDLVGREPICGGSRKVFEMWFF
jgi:hypothetical protein